MPYILRHTDGRQVSSKTYPTDKDSRLAASAYTRRTKRGVEIWWANKAGVPKVMIAFTCNAP